jgi:hypothetical protein
MTSMSTSPWLQLDQVLALEVVSKRYGWLACHNAPAMNSFGGCTGRQIMVKEEPVATHEAATGSPTGRLQNGICLDATRVVSRSVVATAKIGDGLTAEREGGRVGKPYDGFFILVVVGIHGVPNKVKMGVERVGAGLRGGRRTLSDRMFQCSNVPAPLHCLYFAICV